jgi:hypothetical protein
MYGEHEVRCDAMRLLRLMRYRTRAYQNGPDEDTHVQAPLKFNEGTVDESRWILETDLRAGKNHEM